MKEVIVEIDNISFRYPRGEIDALKQVDLEVYQGEWLAIIGPNGSGKSTLAKVINGLLVPYQGQVKVKGLSLNEETVWQVRSHVGMVFQNPDNQFVGATVEGDVAFGLENQGIDYEEMHYRVDEALAKVRMSEFKRHEPARLSGGQKQRVAIASVIALRPEVIILDEATSMLDPLGRLEVIEIIKAVKEEYGLTVISITHDIDEAAQADRIVVLNRGQVDRQAQPHRLFQAGEDLLTMGLDLPFSQRLKQALARDGVQVPPQYLSEEELYQWLMASYFTK